MRPLPRRLACALGACAIAITAACSSTAPRNTLPPVTPIMVPPPIASADAGDLTGGAWRWEGAGGPAVYTVEFMPDGRVLVQADCNRGGGRYTQDAAGHLALTAVATTKMGCPAGSQDALFLRQLADVQAYRLNGNVLELQLRAGGSMRLVR